MHAECFIYGNVNKEKAMQLATLVENQLKKTNAFVLPQLSRQLLLKREYKLSESKTNYQIYDAFITKFDFQMTRTCSNHQMSSTRPAVPVSISNVGYKRTIQMFL